MLCDFLLQLCERLDSENGELNAKLDSANSALADALTLNTKLQKQVSLFY